MRDGRNELFLLLFVTFIFFDSTIGACTFPSSLTGNWVSSEKGILNFTETSLYAYPMDLTVSVKSMDFDCMEKNDTLYILKSQYTAPLFGFSFSIYLCLDIHPVSSNKFWYQVGQDKERSIQERFYAAFENVVVTQTEACTRSTPYEDVTFNTLVKEGAYEAGNIEATCPKSILHKFSNGALTSSDNVTSCSNVTLDVCTERTQMRFTYDASCDPSLTIPSDGMSECLYYITNDTSGITYLHVWNNDTTLATGVTRINCYAYERNGSIISGTMYPGPCDPDQTTDSVPSPGIKIQYNTITKTCQDTVESGSQIIYYVAIAIGAVVFILLIIVLICVIRHTKCRCCKKCCQKCKKKNNQVGQSDEQLTSSRSSGMTSVEDGVDPYIRAIEHSVKMNSMFVAKKPIKLGPIVEPYLEPPAKVELLYEVEPRPTSSRLMFNRSMFFSQLSLRHKE